MTHDLRGDWASLIVLYYNFFFLHSTFKPKILSDLFFYWSILPHIQTQRNVSLLDNAPNYLLSWERYPKETKVATFLYKNSYMSLVFTYVVVIIGKLWMNYNLDYGQRDQIRETSMTWTKDCGPNFCSKFSHKFAENRPRVKLRCFLKKIGKER